MAAAGPAYSTASDNAKRNNAMYCRIITSTPGDLDTQSGQDAMELKEKTCRWTEKFYDMDIDDVKEYVYTNSGNNIVYIEYHYRQLGKDEAWFNRVCRLLNNDPNKIKRELLLRRMRGSEQSPYEADDLQAIEELTGKVKEEIIISKIFKLDVYEELNRNTCYFVGVDVANGYGEDNSAVTIWNPYTLKTVAEFKSAHIGVKDLIKFIYVLVRKHVPKCILIVERNANGEAVLDHLRSTEISGNIYYDSNKELVAPNIDDKLDTHGLLKREAARRKLYGVYTQGKSRELMFGLLEGHIKDHKDKFIGKNIINDIMGLIRTKTGKIEAGPGLHDDSIMSYNMCLYVYYYGNNLQRFGFVRGSLPDESERNQGLLYAEAFESLSDNDKEFFKDAYNPTSVNPEINIKDMIESNRGLISPAELMNADKDQRRQDLKGPVINDPYRRKLMNEMIEAQKESEAFNRNVNFTTSYENTEYDDDDFTYSPNLGLFDELNDL